MERRNKRILCNVEKTVFDIVGEAIVGPEAISFSDYTRGLILKDLQKRGLLPKDVNDSLLMGVQHVDIFQSNSSLKEELIA